VIPVLVGCHDTMPRSRDWIDWTSSAGALANEAWAVMCPVRSDTRGTNNRGPVWRARFKALPRRFISMRAK
jgi:hypothetical protein